MEEKYIKESINNNINLKSNIIFNVPHNEIKIPEFAISDYNLKEKDLMNESKNIADYKVFDIFKNEIAKHSYVKFNYSRLFLDIERFWDDDVESMSRVGMGAIYTNSWNFKNIRNIDNDKEKEIKKIYDNYHKTFSQIVTKLQKKFSEKVWIIDFHSFPGKVRWYDSDDDNERPEICIGINNLEDEKKMAEKVKKTFEKNGFRVKINSPFSGSIYPIGNQVNSLMIEINRKLYLDDELNYVGNSELEKTLKEIIVYFKNDK